MDTHKNARLTPKGREEMVRAVVDRSMSKAAAARGSCAVRGSMVFGAPSIKFPVSQKILMEGRCQVGTRLIRRMTRYGTEVRRTSLASFSPSKIRVMAGIARGLRLNTASKPSSTSCLRTR